MRWGLLSHAQNAVRWLALSNRSVEAWTTNKHISTNVLNLYLSGCSFHSLFAISFVLHPHNQVSVNDLHHSSYLLSHGTQARKGDSPCSPIPISPTLSQKVAFRQTQYLVAITMVTGFPSPILGGSMNSRHELLPFSKTSLLQDVTLTSLWCPNNYH